MGDTHETRGRSMLAAGAGAAAGLAGMLRWRRRDRPTSDGEVLAVTVLGSVDAVERAWLDRAVDVAAADVDVDFVAAPGDRGTEVRMRRTGPPAEGSNGDGDVSTADLRAGLRAFKSVVECGAVVETAPQPTGRGAVAEGLTRSVTDRLRGWTTP